LIERLERANVFLGQISTQPQIGVVTIELAYELAFLRVFLAWEVFLEDVFLRLLCGYARSGGALEPLAAGQNYRRTLADAEIAVLQGRAYKLWHNPTDVVDRAKIFFTGSAFELAIASKQADLGYYAAIRHRIAHAQEHARIQFDLATMQLAARRYRGSRPGRFLRDWKRGTMLPTRHFSAIVDDLAVLAKLICP
jgi:hypothetical protein